MTINTDEVQVNARRKLLVAVGAVLLTTPLAALGQQQSKVARIGYLAGSSMTDNAQGAPMNVMKLMSEQTELL